MIKSNFFTPRSGGESKAFQGRINQLENFKKKTCGTTMCQEVTVGARSRYAFFVPDTLGVGEDAAHDFLCTVECTTNKMIIVDRL
jgi:hypothetical protein